MTRVRFAPSPTGPLHIGGVRTALFNYLFAKNTNGTFILRIEDTDQKRFVEGAEQYILDSLKWLGLQLDEGPETGGNFGPYRQSERTEIYQQYIPSILESGHAYYAFDTPEALEAMRKEYEAEGKTFSYNASTRDSMDNSLGLSQEEIAQKLKENPHYVIRFKMPKEEEILVHDIIRGSFKVNSKELDDKVLVKADGTPTYHFANIIDDHLMEISHVIRGEEWLPSLPLHVKLYEAMGWDLPQFAHLPLILKPVGNGKLSKRDGAQLGFPVFPMEWDEEGTTYLGFKELGYYPSTVINFLSQLGFTPEPENEVLSLSELASQFELEKVHKSGAKFDIKKAEHINKEVLHSMSVEDLISPYMEKLKFWNTDTSKVDVKKVIDVMKERVSFLNELVSESLFFYEAPKAYSEEVLKKVIKEDTPAIMQSFVSMFKEQVPSSAEDYTQLIKNFAEQENIGMGKIMMPLRLSLVGEMKGPDVPVIMDILGYGESLNRIEYLSKFIQA